MINSNFMSILSQTDIVLTDKQINMFENFKNELIEWNKKINLTRIVDDNEIYEKHFLDSLYICKYINENDSVVDVGTGAGFPGIPIKIFYPKSKITLIDSVNKKVIYLNQVIAKLHLDNIVSIHERIEKIGKNCNYREQYDIAVSRAVANMTTLVEYLLPMVKIGGKAICMKGPNIDEELDKSKKAISILGGKIEKIIKYKLPSIENEYNLIIIKKIKCTPDNYPRKEGIPAERPIE